MNEAPQDIDELASILRREYEAADTYYDQLSLLTNQAFEYYEAQPFGNEIEGRSQIVLPDVQETIDYMQQSVLRTFVSGDRTIEFEASDEEGDQLADDATAAINYIFMRQQDGFRILHDGLYDGLLKKMGIFKTVMETVEKVSRQRIRASEEELALLSDQGATVEGYEDNGDGTVTASIKWERAEKRFVDYAIPQSEFRFNPRARHEDEADYLCHVCEKTRSDLVEMGFDQEQAYALPMYSKAPEITETESSTLDNYLREQNTKALETVLLCEEYARIDVDGDGIAERVKVYRVENEILLDAETGEASVEVVDDQPFSIFCPFPRPHRMVGYSLADKVMHIQYQRSFVGRQLFDGLALSNMPRPVVDTNMADAETYDDILSPIPGSPIRVRGGMSSVQPFVTGFDPAKSLSVMEWITGERESLTGITRLNQGLDADALNKTATGTAMMQAQGQQNEEAIARQFAETIGRLFLKKYRLMRAEGEPFKVKVDGQYRDVDPTQWPEDVNLMIRVGLGSNSKDKRIQYRMAMSQALAMSMEQGMSGPEHAFKWFDGMARDTGLGQGDDFAYDPDAEPEVDPATGQPKQKQEKPDPEMQARQAEMQMKQADAQARLELDREKAAATIEAMREKHMLEMDLAREKAAAEAQLARDRMNAEMIPAGEQMRYDAAHKATMNDNRPGGRLDA